MGPGGAGTGMREDGRTWAAELEPRWISPAPSLSWIELVGLILANPAPWRDQPGLPSDILLPPAPVWAVCPGTAQGAACRDRGTDMALLPTLHSEPAMRCSPGARCAPLEPGPVESPTRHSVLLEPDAPAWPGTAAPGTSSGWQHHPSQL